MTKILRLALFFCLLISLFFSSSAQSCTKYTFSKNRIFSSCNDLPVLNSFLHWNYNPSSGTVQIAYRQIGSSSSRWIAWAINPSSSNMVGSQAIVAYQSSNGIVVAYTSPITSHSTRLQKGNLSFAVSNISAEFANEEMTIFATLELPNNSTNVNQVWQEGPLTGSTPGVHGTSGDNVRSMGTLDFLSAQTPTIGGENSRTKKKYVHGLLNAISWGTLMPLGAIIARYLKVFKSADPAWFYLHIACQSSAYIVGVVGWATGLKLGSDSSGIQYHGHRNIGIALFCLGTLQVFALFLRPKKDYKYRVCWNIYHHSIGYTVIILSVLNIFKGFHILDAEKKWKNAYAGILMTLGFNAVLLEAFTWYIVLKRNTSTGSEKIPQDVVNGDNGVNEKGDRPQEVV